MAVSSSAAGQPPASPEEPPLLGSTPTVDLLRDLPTGNSPFVVLETIPPEVTGDRFSGGGLTVATAPRFGAFLNSWTQTEFRIGDVTVTDPRTGGTPLLLPILPMWERMTIVTAAAGVDERAPALSIALEPQRPGATWSRAIEGSLSGPPLVSDVAGAVPAVDRVRLWQEGVAFVSGPVTDRLGLVAGGSWRGSSHVPAPSLIDTSDRVASGFSHLVFKATSRDELRALGWVQRATTAGLTDTAVHVQSTWERRAPDVAWRLFGGYTERSQTAPMPSTVVVDSLTSDPVSDVIDGGTATARRWVLGARAVPAAAKHLPAVGVDLEGARVSVAPTGIDRIDELVNGAPARLWTLRAAGGPGSPDGRHLTTFAAYGNERLTAGRGRLTLDAGVRLDVVTGAADAGAQGITWTTWLPRAVVRWHLADAGALGPLSLVASYRRSAYQLPLGVLAFGDPAAPVADVSVWNGASTLPGPLIAHVGPGTGGDAAFTQIDPRLERPTTDEVVLAFVSRPLPRVQVEVAAIAKREQPLLGVVDVGLPSSSYAAVHLPDPSFLAGSPVGAPQVTAYNRPPGSYGRDRYLLTNQPGNSATFSGFELSVQASTDRFVLLAGGTLTWTAGPAAAIGFLPTENDQDRLGNLLVDPNAAAYARGQLFPDRSHAVKIAGVYRFPWGIRVGAIARYQDGQPFARLVVVPGLTQGTTAVRAYANGGSAFTYTGTLDVRAQKILAAGRSQLAALVDVYNLPNLGNEVTENVVGGNLFRTPTASQPPRTVVAGMRVTF
jgi:hypothetical protein